MERYLIIKTRDELLRIKIGQILYFEADVSAPEPLSEPRRGEFRQRADNTRANRTGNEACQKIVFEPLWRSVFQNYFILKSHLFVQDKHYELCSFKNLLIRSNGFNRLLMDAS